MWSSSLDVYFITISISIFFGRHNFEELTSTSDLIRCILTTTYSHPVPLRPAMIIIIISGTWNSKFSNDSYFHILWLAIKPNIIVTKSVLSDKFEKRKNTAIYQNRWRVFEKKKTRNLNSLLFPLRQCFEMQLGGDRRCSLYGCAPIGYSHSAFRF